MCSETMKSVHRYTQLLRLTQDSSGRERRMLCVEYDDEAGAVPGVLIPHAPAVAIFTEAENTKLLRGGQPSLGLVD